MAHFIGWLREEIRRVIPAIIYFCIAFNVIFYTVGLALPPHQTRYYSYFTATLGGIIIGKIILIVDAMPFFNLFRSYPMIYNIIWKNFVYAAFICLYHILETLVHLLFAFGFNSIVFPLLWHELHSPVFWATEIWSYIFVFFFVVFSEFVVVLGAKKVRHMFFG